MTTIKSCTDLEQSKKLVEILPHESADMHYYKDRFGTYIEGLYNSNDLKDGFELAGIEYAPCWSLAALLDVLPEGIVLLHDINGLGYKCIKDVDTNWHKNPVDACVEMIVKLHESNKLVS